MNKIIFYSVFLVLLASCSTKFPKEIEDVINKCDSETVYLAIIKSPKLKNTFPDAVFSKYYKDKEHVFVIDSADENKHFREDIATSYNASSNKDAIIKVLNTWCEANTFLNALGTTDGEFPPEAVLYEDSSTAYIIKKHLSPQLPGQDWSSLSTYQLYETNVDFMMHVETLSDTQKQKLFAQLTAISTNKQKEK